MSQILKLKLKVHFYTCLKYISIFVLLYCIFVLNKMLKLIKNCIWYLARTRISHQKSQILCNFLDPLKRQKICSKSQIWLARSAMDSHDLNTILYSIVFFQSGVFTFVILIPMQRFRVVKRRKLNYEQ